LLKTGAVSLLCISAAFLAACGPSWSPVEKGSGSNGQYTATADGFYRVRRGDSLYTIAFKLGMDWRDLAEWNDIRSPYIIYPNQELRLTAPPSRVSGEVVTRPARTPAGSLSSDQPRAAVVPDEKADQAMAEPNPTQPAPAIEAAGAVASPQSETRTARPATGASGRDPAAWLWPTEGRLLSTFKSNDPSRNGIEIGGNEGQPIVAAAAGEVVYSGSGLIGYGELIIVKHSDRMLSAYAHNRKRLVGEGQQVAQGEKLAEMGRDDRNRAMLHFEVRVNGTPEDPLKFLPRE